ncbi:hypothetical protein MTO98_03995 [Mucilaginibacter sp. SMC90]|uniref:hypothetical protein n=1 Tax=Mucilaginibacter sp. SMC90 TaxID=2929803 RepID=UPI001FB376F3|nr:hypothetical protein [Mucilaginibacter sp. SMC90]UOE50232.1 hypothetical protein MTO98_03995 [Mucilaginibacter sp. SMC90]
MFHFLLILLHTESPASGFGNRQDFNACNIFQINQKSGNQIIPKSISEINAIITKINGQGYLLPVFGINVYQRKLNSYENKIIPGVAGGRIAAGRM